MSKLYTRTGDDGSTGLFGSDRVGKDHGRVEAYGTVDELNACLGLVVAAGGSNGGSGGAGGQDAAALAQLHAVCSELQSRLFDLGADLATPDTSQFASSIVRISETDVAEVERWIDEIDSRNAAMSSFVLPGGTELAARLHLARTVCRRAERALVALARTDSVNPHAIVYLNRVSDLLFACARAANRAAGVADVPWHARRAD